MSKLEQLKQKALLLSFYNLSKEERASYLSEIVKFDDSKIPYKLRRKAIKQLNR